MEKKLYYTAKEVSEILGISVSHKEDANGKYFIYSSCEQ